MINTVLPTIFAITGYATRTTGGNNITDFILTHVPGILILLLIGFIVGFAIRFMKWGV